jgi:hypothetical protein
MPPSTAAKMAAATDVNLALNTYGGEGRGEGGPFGPHHFHESDKTVRGVPGLRPAPPSQSKRLSRKGPFTASRLA